MAAPSLALKLATRLIVAMSTAAILTCGFASAAQPLSLRNTFRGDRIGDSRKSPQPQVARYEIDEGGVFVLDRSSPRVLLKFEDSPEIWVLQPSAGPRGDIIYKNDLGEPMLRATKLGGMTVFTAKRPGGSAAAMDGASMPLRLGPIGPVALYNRVYQSSARASRAAQHIIGFETDRDADPSSDALIADAAMIAGEALATVGVTPGGRAHLVRLNNVLFAQGARTGVAIKGDTLVITLVVAEGLAGRPSSRRIQSAVMGR